MQLEPTRRPLPHGPVPAWVYVTVASSIGAILALLFLDGKSFWLDEAESVRFADPQRHVGSVALASGGNFAVYYLLLHAWLRFGSSDEYVRLMSVIPAVLCIPAIFALGRCLFGFRTGVIASFLLAINSFFVAYAQEARGYSLLVFLSIVSTLFFVRSIDRPASRLDPVAYVITGVLMVYTHLFGILVLAAHVIALLFLERRRVPWRVFVYSYAATVVALVPLAYVAQRAGAGGLDWVPPISVAAIFTSFRDLAGGPALLVLYAGLTVYAVIEAVKGAADKRDTQKLPAALVLSWLLVPVALAALFSALVTPIFVTRYLIIILPALVLLGSYALSNIRSPAVTVAVSVLVVALSGQGLWHYYFYEPKEDWRGVAAYVVSRAQPGDAVITIPSWLSVPLQHAADRLPKGEAFPVVVNAADPAYAGVRQHQRVWLITTSSGRHAKAFENKVAAQTSRLTNDFQPGKHVSAERSFVDIDVRLYAARLSAHPITH